MLEAVSFMATFGERLRALRAKTGKSQAEVAREMKITRASLSLYELDQRSPDKETISAFADYYHVSVDYLLGRTDDPRPAVEIRVNPFLQGKPHPDDPQSAIYQLRKALDEEIYFSGGERRLDEEGAQLLLEMYRRMTGKGGEEKNERR